MLKNNIQINEDKCKGCGLCVRACPGMLISLDASGKASCRDFEELNWHGCWRCQHCLAVCPEGAISVFGKEPENSLPHWPEDLGPKLEALLRKNRDCTAFAERAVGDDKLQHLFKVIQGAPTGGNKMKIEHLVISGQNPFGLKAPHVLVSHAPANNLQSGSPIVEGEDMVDISISTAYFELLANAHGLGTHIADFPKDAAPELRDELGIPREHVILKMIAFGYPEEAAPADEEFAKAVDSLIAGRTSCRHFRQENVEPALRDRLTGCIRASNEAAGRSQLEYTVIDDIEKMNEIREALRKAYFEMTAQEIYPYSWTKERIDIMESREDQAMNGDMFFCSTPHILMAHMPKSCASAPVDTSITYADFELLCQAFGLGTIYLGYALNVMKQLPEVKAMLGIPEDHFMINAIGFGYPEFNYTRGRQKDGFIKVTWLNLQ